jgi:ribosome maturation factor RimP
MTSPSIDPQLLAEFAAVAARHGCEVLQVDKRGNVLRVTLDHPDGVTLAHCEDVSREISPLLDLADYGGGRYVLEVSSPGLDRPLLRSSDYERFQGHLVRVTRRDPQSGTKATLIGRLLSYRPEDQGCIVVEASDTGEKSEIRLTDVESARLEIEL